MSREPIKIGDRLTLPGNTDPVCLAGFVVAVKEIRPDGAVISEFPPDEIEKMRKRFGNA